MKFLSHVRLLATPYTAPTRLLNPWDFPARVLEWVAIAFSLQSSSHLLTITLSLEKKAHGDLEGPENRYASFPQSHLKVLCVTQYCGLNVCPSDSCVRDLTAKILCFKKDSDFLGFPWSIAHQIRLSMGFIRQEYWSGLPFPSPGNLPDPGIEPQSLNCGQILYHLSHQ